MALSMSERPSVSTQAVGDDAFILASKHYVNLNHMICWLVLDCPLAASTDRDRTARQRELPRAMLKLRFLSW